MFEIAFLDRLHREPATGFKKQHVLQLRVAFKLLKGERGCKVFDVAALGAKPNRFFFCRPWLIVLGLFNELLGIWNRNVLDSANADAGRGFGVGVVK